MKLGAIQHEVSSSEGLEAIREVRDVANDAITLAKQRKQKGEMAISEKSIFTNSQYEVMVRTNLTIALEPNYEDLPAFFRAFIMLCGIINRTCNQK